MNPAQAGAVAPRVTVFPDEGSASGKVKGAGRTSAPPTSGPEPLLAGLTAALGEAFLAPAGGAGSAAWLVSPAVSRSSGSAGYARAATSSSGSAAKGEWSFLADASLSVEDKLALFMQQVQRKTDEDLTRKMEEYRARYASESEAAAKKKEEDEGGGWLSTLLKVVFPPLALADLFTGGDLDRFIGGAVKALGGPLLAALATAVGLPWLAPAAMKAGTALGDAIAGSGKAKIGSAKADKKADRKDGKEAKDAKGTSSSAGEKAGSSTAKKETKKTDDAAKKEEAGSPDERLAMLEIQRIVDKQNQMFQLVSNVLKGMHETNMVAIQNLR